MNKLRTAAEKIGLNRDRALTAVGLAALAGGVAIFWLNDTNRALVLNLENINTYAATHDVPTEDYWLNVAGTLLVSAGLVCCSQAPATRLIERWQYSNGDGERATATTESSDDEGIWYNHGTLHDAGAIFLVPPELPWQAAARHEIEPPQSELDK